MKLDMLPILNGSKTKLAFSYELRTEENEVFADDGFVFHDITFTKPIAVSGEVISQAGYMELHLEAVVSYATHCARCLQPIEDELTFRVEKPIAGKTGALRLENKDTDEDDYVLIEDNALSLDEPVSEQIFAEFPMRHLCREDCKGLCPKCGKNLNEGECGCDLHEQDPRLAALAKLLEK